MPSKEVPAKIGSLDKISHKPGGGAVQVIDEKPVWNTKARIDHLAKNYKPGGKCILVRVTFNILLYKKFSYTLHKAFLKANF